MISQSGQCAHHVCNHDNGAQAGCQNAEEVHEVIENIQHVQAGGGRHQQQRNQSHRNNHQNGGRQTGSRELVLNTGDNHLKNRNEGGETRKEQGTEEEDTNQHAAGRLRNNGRERDERQTNTAGRNLAHLGASSLSHEAQSREHTNTSKKLETGVRETNHSTGTGQVSLRLQIGRIGDHNAEANGQREENLAVSSNPHVRVSQRIPAGGEQSVQAVHSAGQGQRVNHQTNEHDQQQRDEDNVGCAHALLNAQSHHSKQNAPHQNHGNQDVHVEVQGDAGILCDLQELALEERLRVIAPLIREGENHVTQSPRHNSGVVDSDDEVNTHVPPTNELGLTVQTAESQRGRRTRTVTDRVVKEQEGQTGGQQGDNVGNHEGAAAVIKCDVGETPNIAQTNSRTDGGKDKDATAREAFTLRGRLRGRCSHSCKPRMCGDADGWCENNPSGWLGSARVQK